MCSRRTCGGAFGRSPVLHLQVKLQYLWLYCFLRAEASISQVDALLPRLPHGKLITGTPRDPTRARGTLSPIKRQPRLPDGAKDGRGSIC
jgi:hypothetical protein